ncbi:MAG TPA: TonB-dependent receptor [Thermoanaerobaculia bacterium]|nr:TonB-dependent receptor [Thermoanaerobaculia bacterium]
MLLVTVLATAAWAGETGSVSGVVKDGGGLAVPGATVKITGAQAPRTTVTNASGAFKFDVLLPGDYVVTADLKGLGSASQKVRAYVDNDAQLTLILVSSAKAEVVVTGAAAEIDKTSSESNFNYTDNTLKDLPLSRTYQGVIKIIPGAPTDTSGQGFVSISGGTRQDNKYLLDGVNVTNPGYGWLGVDTNQLDIADFNVKKAGISAEFGRTSGAMINAVTKSGSNQIAGAVQVNLSPSSFQANRSFDVQSDTDLYNGQANFGFPIIKDTLFGYVSGAYYDAKTSGQSATVGGVTTTQPDSKSHNGDYFGKLTYFAGQSLLVNAGFRALPAKSTDQFGSIYDLPSAAQGADTTNYVGNLSVDWFASKNTVVEAKYVYLEQNDTSAAQTVLAPFQPAVINPKNLGAYGAYADPARNGGNVGVPEFAETGEKYKRSEIKATLSQYFDGGSMQHAFKVGGGYEDAQMDTVRATNGWGIWATGQTCPASVCGTSVSGTVRARYYTSQPVQYSLARTYSAFIQDTITMKNLTVYLGVLVNKDDFAQLCKTGNVCGSSTTAPNTSDVRYNFMTFDWSQEIQPRLGITWNTNLLPSDKFYATYGEYAGVDQKSTARSFAPYRIRQDQAYFNGTTGVFLGSQYRGSSGGKVIPPDLKPPKYEEFSVGYSAALTKDISVDAYYQYRNLKNAFEDAPIDVNNYFGSFQAKNFFNARRTYDALTIDIQKRYSNSWYADMNVTFSRLYGNWDEDYGIGLFNTSSFLEDEPGWNSADPNRYGHLGQDRPIIFKLMGSYDLPMGFVVGGFLRVQSGTPWEARGGTPSTTSGRYLEPAGTNRLPTWTTVDLLLAYNLKLGGNMAVRLEARVANVFDTQTVLSVNSIKYNDGYVDGNPAGNLGWQQTNQPNANFGNATSWSSPRRFTLTARLDF